MSSYSDFIQDFPTRSIEILDLFSGLAKENNREVTLMLAIAAIGFTIPFERLKSTNHPSIDREKFKIATSRFDSLRKLSFLTSELWDEGEGWLFADKLEGVEISRQEVENWANPEILKPLTNEKNVDCVLSLLRNSFAHGNIFTYPSGNRDQPVEIKYIIFIRKEVEDIVCGNCSEIIENYGRPTGRYNLLAVSPEKFNIFLKKWVIFLKSLDLSIS
jgi:hypothetical protein